MDSGVRSRSGAPVTEDFSSSFGTPIVVNTDTGLAYVMLAGVAAVMNSTYPTPITTDAVYDTTPLAALHIAAPTTPTTRNFVAGLWVETNGSAVDKGRGIMVSNYGASDAIYVQLDGPNGTGEAILLTTAAASATGMVIGTTLSSHIGLALRQETAILAAANGVLLSIAAEGAATEMVRIGSATIAAQTGIVFRLYGANSKPFVVKDSLGADQFVLNNIGDVASVGAFSFTGTADSFIEGIVKQGATAQAANNAQVVTVANVGPGAAGISILSWRKTKDSAGNLRYIPLFG